ncbi:MAG: ATP-binding cassette domain-containing protein [Cardiobacteriaceae bacterium]|nr:ATP-binding cassette domain-containing protein [Cardiobacteriaceae bacterium]
MDEVIRVENVSFFRGKRAIFKDLSFSVRRGEVLAIMGPSGTGKTTLLKLLTGQLKPAAGEIHVLGERVDRLAHRDLMRLRERMSMLFQSGALFSDMSVAENVAFPIAEKYRLDKEVLETLVRMKLHGVGLEAAADLLPNELSGGMARRAALARAIVMDPELMIYDEPFTGQDPISLGVLAKLIRDLNDGLAMTSLVVSHDVAEVARIADRILLLANAGLVALDTPEALFASGDALVHQFMHAEADGPVAYHFPGSCAPQSLWQEDGC